MKKKWMAACGVTAFFLSAGIALWMEKPALTQMAGQAITTTANSKLNGTLSFSSLDISLKASWSWPSRSLEIHKGGSSSKGMPSGSTSIPEKS